VDACALFVVGRASRLERDVDHAVGGGGGNVACNEVVVVVVGGDGSTAVVVDVSDDAATGTTCCCTFDSEKANCCSTCISQTGNCGIGGGGVTYLTLPRPLLGGEIGGLWLLSKRSRLLLIALAVASSADILFLPFALSIYPI